MLSFFEKLTVQGGCVLVVLAGYWFRRELQLVFNTVIGKIVHVREPDSFLTMEDCLCMADIGGFCA